MIISNKSVGVYKNLNMHCQAQITLYKIVIVSVINGTSFQFLFCTV